MAEPLSQREFDLWREGHDDRMERLLDYMDSQVTLNRSNEGRIVALETNQAAAGKLSARLSGAVGAVVAALISGVFHFIGGRS